MLSWVSPVLGWALKCLAQGHSHEKTQRIQCGIGTMHAQTRNVPFLEKESPSVSKIENLFIRIQWLKFSYRSHFLSTFLLFGSIYRRSKSGRLEVRQCSVRNIEPMFYVNVGAVLVNYNIHATRGNQICNQFRHKFENKIAAFITVIMLRVYTA